MGDYWFETVDRPSASHQSLCRESPPLIEP